MFSSNVCRIVVQLYWRVFWTISIKDRQMEFNSIRVDRCIIFIGMISGWRLDLIILYSNKAQGHSVDGYILGGAICSEY